MLAQQKKKEHIKDNTMCKRAVLCSFLLDQNHREQGDEDGYREEKGGQQQGGAGQVHSHPATASGLSTAVT